MIQLLAMMLSWWFRNVGMGVWEAVGVLEREPRSPHYLVVEEHRVTGEHRTVKRAIDQGVGDV